jgi:transcription initiation factor TFIIIB Brf1 subunit/transcription initiation factor TFIIB
MLDLLAIKKLGLNKMYILETRHPYEYVLNVVQNNSFKIPQIILQQVQQLIQLCEENDLLLDHTPLSIGVSCFYYVLKANEIELDVKVFSNLYNISVVTVVKTYNKLKQYDNFITIKLRD